MCRSDNLLTTKKTVLRLYEKIVIETRGSQNKVTHIDNHLIVISASQSC